ncbi:Cnl2/NKP2 family protein-domain-containing protein [Tuber borchii]|uniref:Cnl2/NKP2 family protein-domain-containing protein n=1 Tax=Tuber borchii TaxID=42251 RepID=A0A2T6ZLQ8_TUBBO|nr:Cnl2/NKP2 family protein-domain-containing protein [Tuber borchii]
MASTTKDLETQILSSFLLSRASLQDIISLRQFTELFPRDQRSNPQVKLLYRELQLLRNKTCERVKKNIKHEAALGIKQRSELEKKQRALKRVDDETMTAIELFGAAPMEPKLPLKELLKQMNSAVEDLDAEFNALDGECDRMLEELKSTIGDLSDLRYGKFAASDTDARIVRDLENLHDTCERALNPPS